MTTALLSYNGHPASCLCEACMAADLDATLAERGEEIRWSGAELATTKTAVRTRYAQPGQRVGHGVVRLVSAKQVAYIRRLMAERDTSRLVRLPGSENIERMSLAGARDLIDRLLGCPMRPADQLPPARMATDGQRSFLRSLAERKGYPIDETRFAALTMRQASALIEEMKGAPDAPRPVTTQNADLRLGVYRKPDGTIVGIRKSRQSGHHYGMVYRPDSHTFEYVKGSMAGLTPDMFLTLDEVERLSVQFGQCLRCGRLLTNGESVKLGIGPICRAKYGNE